MKKVTVDEIYKEEFTPGTEEACGPVPPFGLCPLLVHAWLSFYGKGQPGHPMKKMASLTKCGPFCSWYLGQKTGHTGHNQPRCGLVYALLNMSNNSDYLENLEDISDINR